MSASDECPMFEGTGIAHHWIPLDKDHGPVAQACLYCDTWMFPTTPAATVRMDIENTVARAFGEASRRI